MKKYIILLFFLLSSFWQARAGNISGPTAVCVGDVETYTAGTFFCAPGATGKTWSWGVIGGTVIGSSTNSSVTVRWNHAGNRTITVDVFCTGGGGHLRTSSQVKIQSSSFDFQSLAVDVRSIPSAPGLPETKACHMAEQVTHVVSSLPTSGISYRWYTSPSGGDPIATGRSYTGVATQAYYVSAYNGRCESTRIQTQVKVVGVPTLAPNISGSSTACQGSTTRLTASYPGSTTDYIYYNWYKVSGGTESFKHKGNYFDAPDEVATYRVKAFYLSRCGEGPVKEFSITQVSPIPTVSVRPENAQGNQIVDRANRKVKAVVTIDPTNDHYWSYDTSPSISGPKATSPQTLREGQKIYLYRYDGCWSEPVEYTAVGNGEKFEGRTIVCEGDIETYKLAVLPEEWCKNDTWRWQWDEPAGGEIIESSNSTVKIKWLHAGVLPQTLTVKVFCGNSFADMQIESLSVQVNSIPNPPAMIDGQACFDTDEMTLAVGDLPISGINYRWYSSPSATSPFFIGRTYTTTGNQTFYVAAHNNICESERVAVTATVLGQPVRPSISGSASVCVNDRSPLRAEVGNAISSVDFNWYRVDGNEETWVHTGNVYHAPPMLATYRAKAFYLPDCEEGPAAEFSITEVKQLPIVNVVPKNADDNKIVSPTLSRVEAIVELDPTSNHYWSFDDSPSTSDPKATELQYLKSGEEIYLYRYDGCWSEPVKYYAIGNDDHLNWTHKRYFDQEGNEVSANKAFYDYSGDLLQSQSKNYTDQTITLKQLVSDKFNQTAIKTLPVVSDHFVFGYRKNLITTEGGKAYTQKQFGKPLDKEDQESVGWYYSEHNTLEGLTPATEYPYLRSEFYYDGRGSKKRVAKAGEGLQIGSGHEAYAKSFPLLQELDESTDITSGSKGRYSYLHVRNHLVFGDQTTAKPKSIAFEGSKQVVRDQHGVEIVKFMDKDGNNIASALVGEGYDQLVAPVALNFHTPMFWANFEVELEGENLQMIIDGTDFVQVYRSFAGHQYELVYEGHPQSATNLGYTTVDVRDAVIQSD